MANPDHVAIVKSGLDAFEQWRKQNNQVRLDLRQADLSDLNLQKFNLSNSDLGGANLSSSDLSDAQLNNVTLNNANLSNCKMIRTALYRTSLRSAKLLNATLDDAMTFFTDFTDADLRGASLLRTKLGPTTLRGTKLTNTDMGGASFGGALLADLDLSTTKGLRTTIHGRPTFVGVETLYKSKGAIPEEFLRGCGVPDGLIAYLPSLLGMQEAIQFYSCFISFSYADEEFCQRLHSRMRDEHLRVWFAPEDIKGGEKVHEQIEEAIKVYDKLLLVLSEASMASEWVKTEIYHARQREITENRRILFPISLVPFAKVKEWKAFDADSGKDMAREVREYYVPDFTEWKQHDAFENAFSRLLKDLRKEGTK